MNAATITFGPGLHLFLARAHRNTRVSVPCTRRTTVKDAVAALGVPHPTLEQVWVHGVPVTLRHTLVAGDDVLVLGWDDARPGGLALRPPVPVPTAFVLDAHLGRLACYLRMVGFDTLYRNDYDDHELARVAHDEQRVLLSRDVGLLKRSLVVWGHFVRATDPRARLAEVLARYALADQVRPFVRCTKCNGLLHASAKADVLAQLPARVAHQHDAFYACAQCGRVYWPGSHFTHMQALLADVLAAR